MKIHISERLDKLEATRKRRDAVSLAMVCLQPGGDYAFRIPEKLRGMRFTADELHSISDRCGIGTLIINDRSRWLA